VVHGLLDHVMTMLGVPLDAEKGYSIKEASDALSASNMHSDSNLNGQIVKLTTQNDLYW